MTRSQIAGGFLAAVLVLLVLAVGLRILLGDEESGVASPADSSSTAEDAVSGEVSPDLLYGRVTTGSGETYEGRLRWAGGEEAFWGEYLNGEKAANPWVAHVPPEQRPMERRAFEIFGLTLAEREREADLRRPFMMRFGDVARIEVVDGGDEEAGAEVGEEDGPGNAFYPDVRVILKSGTAFQLDRSSAGDFDDGLRVWDPENGVVDLAPRQIRSIEFLAVPEAEAPANRLHGTVRTREGQDFTGFLQWNREEGMGSDELQGQTADGEVALPFDTLRSIQRLSPDSARATLADGRQVVLSDSWEVGRRNRGVYVDDPRYGRVLVSWRAFDRVDFSDGGHGPAYDDFPPGQPLTGRVTTRDGRRLGGRLVFDLDESETTETLDAPAEGVDYTIPFALVAAIELPAGGGDGGVDGGADGGGAGGASPPARVTLHSGEELPLRLRGDLGPGNAGLLVFLDGGQGSEYVPWSEVARIELDRPPAAK